MVSSTRNLYDESVRLMYHHVLLTTNDGNTFDGIIETVDNDNLTVLVGEDILEEETRQFDYDYYNGYGGYGGYGRPRRRFRRFRRRRFPFPYVTAISLFPYIYPVPYPYPSYPYPYY